MNLRHWRFKAVEWLDAWMHIHICNLYERLLDTEIDDGRHPPIPQEDDEE